MRDRNTYSDMRDRKNICMIEREDIYTYTYIKER